MRQMHPKRHDSLGLSLIELLVSIALGMVVVGTVIALFVGSSDARRQAQAFSEMNDDGLYAVRILSQQIRLAGFNPLHPSLPNLTPTNPFPGDSLSLPIFGCASSFANGTNTGSGYSGTASHLLTCDAANTTSHAIAVTYEADAFNTKSTGAGTPTDCLGNGLIQLTNPTMTTVNYFIAENRYYVDNNNLFCAGSGGGATSTFSASPQPIVANVEQLTFQYGVMPAALTNTSTVAAGYLAAGGIGTASGVDASADPNLQPLPAPARWKKVVTVKICVMMRSSTQVLTSPQPYFPCAAGAAPVTPTDRFARRAFVSTVNLRNGRP